VRVFVAGATGALGVPLVTRLAAHGHEVTGLTRQRGEIVVEAGGRPALADAFDAEALRKVVVDAQPEALVHALTRIPHAAVFTPGRLKINNRLRTEGTANLLAAARAAGTTRVVVESVTFAYQGRSEQKMQPLIGMGSFQEAVDAVVEMEKQVKEYEGIVLRFGYFYGPGTSVTEKWPQALRRRALPMVGKGTGWWSFIHVDDAASAMIAALERGRAGEVYNICDDEPILARDALSTVAAATGGPKPLRLPNVGPYYARQYFNDSTGANNAKARRELEWAPVHRTFKEGFVADIAAGE
jgi:nucleoside-diphosphate-sugar epimerase